MLCCPCTLHGVLGGCCGAPGCNSKQPHAAANALSAYQQQQACTQSLLAERASVPCSAKYRQHAMPPVHGANNNSPATDLHAVCTMVG